jgi:heat shock protein HslJ
LIASLPASAQPAHADEPSAAFAGAVPQSGGLAFLVASETTSAARLTPALRASGCEPRTLAVTRAGGWALYVPGAPAAVNAGFPDEVPASTPFAVRCAEVAGPKLDVASMTVSVGGFTFTLKDGRDEQAIVPGSATKAIAQLANRAAYGDLDGDGATDAAFVLWFDGGGSGTFYYVGVLTAGDTVLEPILLGDRIRVQHVSIVGGELVVAFLTRRPLEPFTAEPSVPVERAFVADGDRLAPAGCTAGSPGTQSAFVFATSPRSGDRLPSGSLVEGCSRTFESTVNWTLFDRAGTELASGFTSGGGVDGPAPFSFTVTYDVDGEQVGWLEVFEVDVSGGEGFPPPRDVVPVVLTEPLTEKTWGLVTIAGQVLVAGTEITAAFQDGTVAGSSGCNSYSGGYQVTGGSISFDAALAVTLRACETAVMDQESAYLQALGAAESFAVNGDTLTIETGEGDLVFSAESSS